VSESDATSVDLAWRGDDSTGHQFGTHRLAGSSLAAIQYRANSERAVFGQRESRDVVIHAVRSALCVCGHIFR